MVNMLQLVPKNMTPTMNLISRLTHELKRLHLGMEKEEMSLQLDRQAWVNGLIKFRSTTYPMLIMK
jgi:hypothetical protein